MKEDLLGKQGEDIACKFLMNKNFIILSRNFRAGKLELDIVAEKNNQLVVIEVKTRSYADIGEPWRAVTKHKQKQIIKAANAFIQKNNIHLETRFDIVSIIHNQFKTEIEHIEEAFYPI